MILLLMLVDCMGVLVAKELRAVQQGIIPSTTCCLLSLP